LHIGVQMEALFFRTSFEGDRASDCWAFANPGFYLRMKYFREFAIVYLRAYDLILGI